MKPGTAIRLLGHQPQPEGEQLTITFVAAPGAPASDVLARVPREPITYNIRFVRGIFAHYELSRVSRRGPNIPTAYRRYLLLTGVCRQLAPAAPAAPHWEVQVQVRDGVGAGSGGDEIEDGEDGEEEAVEVGHHMRRGGTSRQYKGSTSNSGDDSSTADTSSSSSDDDDPMNDGVHEVFNLPAATRSGRALRQAVQPGAPAAHRVPRGGQLPLARQQEEEDVSVAGAAGAARNRNTGAKRQTGHGADQPLPPAPAAKRRKAAGRQQQPAAQPNPAPQRVRRAQPPHLPGPAQPQVPPVNPP